MMISTKGRYALRVMIDLANNGKGGYLAMKDIAERQGISLKYLEKILPSLVSAGLIEGVTGKKGGYKLSRKPEECTVGEILRLSEGDLAPVACLSLNSEACERSAECKTLPMWRELNQLINSFLDGKTLADFI